MNTKIFDAVAEILLEQFQVDAPLVRPETTLDSLGLDSLTLMEFVFAVEDHFSVRIPEEQLDPRQLGITLSHLTDAIEGAMPSALRVEAKAA
jgi:acyl carrier protein